MAAERRRFGYRRLHLLLKREGIQVNHKKLYRIYKEERLAVRKRSGRKRAVGTRAPIGIPQDSNPRWIKNLTQLVLEAAKSLPQNASQSGKDSALRRAFSALEFQGQKDAWLELRENYSSVELKRLRIQEYDGKAQCG